MPGLADTLLQSASWAGDHQRADGSFPAGANGPHEQGDTPVRNTACWLQTLSWAAVEAGGGYVAATDAALSYLLSDAARPVGLAWDIRRDSHMPRTGGLNAQTWVIDALLTANDGGVAGAPAVQAATEVVRAHPFNERAGLWRSIELDGTPARTDRTLNHQIAFAAQAARVADRVDAPALEAAVDRFLDRLPHLIQQSDDGLFERLRLTPQVAARGLADGDAGLAWAITRPYLKAPWRRLTGRQRDPNRREKAVGYQGYHLYGLALLYRERPAHPVWDRPFLADGLAVVRDRAFADALAETRYGWPWNPCGFEIAFALETFTDETDLARWWAAEQLRRTFDWQTGTLDRATAYASILRSRCYVGTRLPDYDLPTLEPTARNHPQPTVDI